MMYLLFAGETYYPCGGWEDFQGQFDSLEACREEFARLKAESFLEWGHVVLLETRKIVEELV